MRKILGIFVVVFLALTAFSQVSAEDIQKKAVIGFLKGDVKVIKMGESIANTAKLGMTLVQGDKILTGSESRIELKFDDGTNFRIGDNSSVVLEELKQENNTDKSTMKVLFGRAWLNIKKTLNSAPTDSKIITPKVTAAVKGTTYKIDVDKDGETNVNVYDGTVAVTKDGKEESVNKLETIASKDLIKGKFDEEKDAKDEWVKWNKNRDKLRVMIVFNETINKEKSVVALSEVIFAEEMLKNYQYSVIDQNELNKVRESEKLVAALKGDPAAAAVAGLEIGADLIITGDVKTDSQKIELYGATFISGVASMTVKAVRCDTAATLSAGYATGKYSPENTDLGAISGAVRKAAVELLKKTSDDIISSWKKEASKSASINIVLTGVTFESSEKVRQSLSSIQGVKDVNQISFVAGRALLTLSFAGDSLSLAEKIGQQSIQGVKATVVGLSLNKLEIEVK